MSEVAEVRKPSFRRWWPLMAVAILIAMLVGGVAAALRAEGVQRWLRDATGEESVWEGAKGAVALALLDLGGDDLELAPMDVEAHASVRPVGVNTFLQLEPDPAVVRRSYELMRDAGVGFARQHFPWEDIEIHERGDYEDRRNDPPRSAWDKYDRLVQLSEDYGVQLLGRLDDPPAWAYDDPESEGPQKGPPSDLTAWADFVEAVVGRYCGRVRYWQLWNEPNIYPEWGERDVDPGGYVDLLAVGATAARAACADVVIVSAALAQTTEPGGRNMDDLAYLQALYDAEWSPHFDVLAAQAFGLWTGPTDHRASRDRANFPRVTLSRDVMVRNGDAHKAVWITEFGWNSVPEGRDAPYGRVSEEVRARYTLEAYERIADEWPWVGASFLWFLRRPTFEWHERPEGWFRLVDPDWTESPSMAAIREIGLRPPVLQRGRHEVNAPALGYTGAWRREPPEGRGGEQLRVGSRGAELQAPFRGTAVHIVARFPDAVDGAVGAGATAGVSDTRSAGDAADTASLAASDTVSATIFAVLDGESQTAVLTPSQPELSLAGLDNDFHILILRVDGGELPLDEIRVEAPVPPHPLRALYGWLAGLAAATIAVVGLAIIAWGRGRRGQRRERAAGANADGVAAVGDTVAGDGAAAEHGAVGTVAGEDAQPRDVTGQADRPDAIDEKGEADGDVAT